jgi:multiple sugar transport system ATP-binding protein
MNFVAGTLTQAAGGLVMRAGDDIAIPLPNVSTSVDAAAGRAVTLGIRPEDILVGEEAASCDFRWNASVALRESLGSETLLWCSLAGSRVAVKSPSRLAAHVGDRVPLGFSSDRVSLFDARTQERV